MSYVNAHKLEPLDCHRPPRPIQPREPAQMAKCPYCSKPPQWCGCGWCGSSRLEREHRDLEEIIRYVKAGALSINAARQMFGLPPIAQP